MTSIKFCLILTLNYSSIVESHYQTVTFSFPILWARGKLTREADYLFDHKLRVSLL